jgi:hypothetical protein
MASRYKPVGIYSIFVALILASIVCAAGWFQAREESRQLREMNRHLVAQNSTVRNSGVVNGSAAAAYRHSHELSPPVEDGQLILPPGLGQEFPESLLPMTPNRATNFERRQIIVLPAPRRVVTDEDF